MQMFTSSCSCLPRAPFLHRTWAGQLQCPCLHYWGQAAHTKATISEWLYNCILVKYLLNVIRHEGQNFNPHIGFLEYSVCVWRGQCDGLPLCDSLHLHPHPWVGVHSFLLCWELSPLTLRGPISVGITEWMLFWTKTLMLRKSINFLRNEQGCSRKVRNHICADIIWNIFPFGVIKTSLAHHSLTLCWVVMWYKSQTRLVIFP